MGRDLRIMVVAMAFRAEILAGDGGYLEVDIEWGSSWLFIFTAHCHLVCETTYFPTQSIHARNRIRFSIMALDYDHSHTGSCSAHLPASYLLSPTVKASAKQAQALAKGFLLKSMHQTEHRQKRSQEI